MDMPNLDFKTKIKLEQEYADFKRGKSLENEKRSLDLERTKMEEIKTLLSTVEPEILAAGGAIEQRESGGLRVFDMEISFEAQKLASHLPPTGDYTIALRDTEFLKDLDPKIRGFKTDSPIPNLYVLKIPDKPRRVNDYYQTPKGAEIIQDVLSKYLARKIKLS